MKTYLVEEYSPKIEFDKDSVVVALTPKVCYKLDKERIKYSIIEDYYDEVELSSHEDDYYKSQLQWTDRLDEFLQRNIKELKELNLKLGTIYYYYLKTMVLDTLYIRCYTLRRLFEAVKPSAITIVSLPPKETSLDFTLHDDSRSYYSLVTPILCKQNNIPLEAVFLEPDIKKGIKAVSRYDSFTTRLKRILAKSGMARSAYFFYKYRIYLFYKFSQKWLFARQARQKRLNIFLLKLSHIGADFVIDALRNGHRIYQLSEDSITRYSCFGTIKYLNLKAEKAKARALDNSTWENAANLLESHDLIKWVNGICELDVSGIVLPRLKYFISRVCPEIFEYFQAFTEFYQQDKIDFVITPHEVLPAEFAAIAAANHSHRTVSVCVQHGEGIFDTNFWKITELFPFKIYISSNKEMMDYFISQCRANNIPTEFYGSAHRLLNIEKINRLREQNESNIKKNRIIYLPTIFMGNHRRFDGQVYPDTWYYKFQKALIEYFSTKREYIFVWKGLPVSDAIYNPAPNFIMDNNFSNIEIATNPFPEHLFTAHRVICDFPSTGFYESVVAGVPTMSLYHEALIVRKSAVEYFGNLLKPFSNIPEAINHIDEFLNSDPELYKTTIEMEDKSILDILEEIGKRTNW